MRIDLSLAERRALGHRKRLANGEESEFWHPTAALWPAVRRYLVARSLRSNPALDPQLTAYTPGETWGLLQHPTVLQWQRAVSHCVVPPQYRAVAFVPCAKSKPWTGPAASRSQLYTAYNRLAREFPDVFFVTVSEPLGIVPMTRWGNFPQYDNPGLFHDDSLRSGMTTAQWAASPFGSKLIIPFDESMYPRCVERLGDVIASFMRRNTGLAMLSFVDASHGPSTTHTDMLRSAEAKTRMPVEHFDKKPVPHHSPYGHIRRVLLEHGLGHPGIGGEGLCA